MEIISTSLLRRRVHVHLLMYIVCQRCILVHRWPRDLIHLNLLFSFYVVFPMLHWRHWCCGYRYKFETSIRSSGNSSSHLSPCPARSASVLSTGPSTSSIPSPGNKLLTRRKNQNIIYSPSGHLKPV